MLFAAPSSPTADQPLQPPIAEDGPKVGGEGGRGEEGRGGEEGEGKRGGRGREEGQLLVLCTLHVSRDYGFLLYHQDGEEEAPLPLSSFQKGAWPTKESVNVMVTHVVDPGHFYVQIIGQNSLEPLHTLQEDMT